MTFLFHNIARIITAKLICIKSINNKHKCKPENIVNLKKISTIHNTKKYSGVIVKSNIIFITFNEKNEKEMLFILKKRDKNLLLRNNIKLLN